MASDTFGSGNKLLHNVTGGIGVVEGNGCMLRYFWALAHDGNLTRTAEGLHLVALDEAGQMAWRCDGNLEWSKVGGPGMQEDEGLKAVG